MNPEEFDDITKNGEPLVTCATGEKMSLPQHYAGGIAKSERVLLQPLIGNVY
jgi:hypothetical protein